MTHTIHDFAQGSEAWHAHRRAHLNASEVPALLGISPYQSRSELLKAKAIGSYEEVSPEQQALFDNGHRFEALARPWGEEIIGDDLYPIVASAEVDGLPLSASYDGSTMGEDEIMEHKTLNREIVASLDRGEIPEQYRAQMEQQLLIIGAVRCLFMASNGDRETMRQAWYESDPAMRARLIAAWKQFTEDLKAYRHVEEPIKPAGKVMRDLPALTVQLVGEVKSSNLVVFRQTALAVIESINTNLTTDEDFASAEIAVKFCSDVEERLDFVKRQAIGQTATIDELFRTIDELRETTRQKRLSLEKLVTARKQTIREDIRREGADAYAVHITMLNTRLGKPYMPPIVNDFAGVMKGKRTIASLRDAISTELARVKIAANEVADRIQINLIYLREHAKDHTFLFADTAQIVLKAPDDLATLVKMRITEHKAAEQKRLDDEREKIRQEEAAKLAAAQPPAPATAAPPPPPPPAPAAAAQPGATKPIRPADDDIIRLIATNFKVHDITVILWLGQMDLKTATARRARKTA